VKCTRYIRPSKKSIAEVKVSPLLTSPTSGADIIDSMTSINDVETGEKLMKDEIDWNSSQCSCFAKWIADNEATHPATVAAAVENAKEFINTLFCSLNRRLMVPDAPLMKALAMLDPSSWVTFSHESRIDEVRAHVETILERCPILLKHGVKGSQGLRPMESAEMNIVYSAFENSAAGHKSVEEATTLGVLKGRIVGSAKAYFFQRHIEGRGSPYHEVDEAVARGKDLCRYYQVCSELSTSYQAFCSVAEHALANLLTTLACETGFSTMSLMKTTLRNGLGHEFITGSSQV
jgi:hypothetical protein